MCLTEEELTQSLSMIKETLDKSKQMLYNIIFLNNECFYSFLKQLYCSNGETIAETLNKLEHCIPFALTDDSFCLFLSSCQSENGEKWKLYGVVLLKAVKTIFYCIYFPLQTPYNGNIFYKAVKCYAKKIVPF